MDSCVSGMNDGSNSLIPKTMATMCVARNLANCIKPIAHQL